MIKTMYIHKVCGFSIVYGTCKHLSCDNCPIGRLLEIAREKAANPKTPESGEEPDAN